MIITTIAAISAVITAFKAEFKTPALIAELEQLHRCIIVQWQMINSTTPLV